MLGDMTTTAMLVAVSVLFACHVLTTHLFLRYWRGRCMELQRRLDYEGREKMRLYWENVALEEDSNARTVRTVRQDLINLTLRHSDVLRSLGAISEEQHREAEKLRESLPPMEEFHPRDDA